MMNNSYTNTIISSSTSEPTTRTTMTVDSNTRINNKPNPRLRTTLSTNVASSSSAEEVDESFSYINTTPSSTHTNNKQNNHQNGKIHRNTIRGRNSNTHKAHELKHQSHKENNSKNRRQQNSNHEMTDSLNNVKSKYKITIKKTIDNNNKTIDNECNSNISTNTIPKEKPSKDTHQKDINSKKSTKNRKVHSNSDDYYHQDLSLTQRIIKQLSSEDYECLVCYELVKAKDYTWDCKLCYKVFHLKCIRKWCDKSTNNTSSTSFCWRCPGCQNENKDFPNDYTCFCGKTSKPILNSYFTPHSCGQVCGKDRACLHLCSEACHPGPCEPCEAYSLPISCFCGKKEFVVKCSAIFNLEKSCGSNCGKPLDCSRHLCCKPCHEGLCGSCSIELPVQCVCGQEIKSIPCVELSDDRLFRCENECKFMFDCKIHNCEKKCHDYFGKHKTLCPMDTSLITTCACGKTSITQLNVTRKSCQDPIPTCSKVCGKQLSCGHSCSSLCHSDECQPCEIQVSHSCRCEYNLITLTCQEFDRDERINEILAPLCHRICNKKMLCKRHKCNNICCAMDFHICESLCGKLLSCKFHNCTYDCGHDGACHTCIEGVVFEERSCHCGRTKMYPPIPCNTGPPICHYPCERELICGHQMLSTHECHPDEVACPPCRVFVCRRCACGKKVFENIPCSRIGLPNCGMPCELNIPSCGHPCRKLCQEEGHCSGSSSIKNVDDVCKEKCGYIRSLCGHQCGYRCHGTTVCPETKPCAAKVKITCPCGHRSSFVNCGLWKGNLTFNEKTECNYDCSRIQRNINLAAALKINVNKTVFEDRSAMSLYSANLIAFAHDNLVWLKQVENTILVFMKVKSKTVVETSSVDTANTMILDANISTIGITNIHHFPSYKPQFNQYLAEYIKVFELDAHVLDEDRGKGNVMMRYNPNSHIPKTLLSKVASEYNSHEHLKYESFDSIIKYHGAATNAILIKNLLLDIEVGDLQVLLQPLFGGEVVLALKAIERTVLDMDNHEIQENDCVLIVSGTSSQSGISMDMEQMELFLIEKLDLIKEKFVRDNIWAKDVVPCWITRDGEIREDMKPKRNTAKKVQLLAYNKVDVGLSSENIYDLIG